MKLPPISRRQFLQRTFAFTASSMIAGCGTGITSNDDVQDAVTGGTVHILMVGDWGETGNPSDQSQVAVAMKKYAEKYSLTPDALFMLGDNFYGSMVGGVQSIRWMNQFENMYPASVFPNPAYAVPGNHDYQVDPVSKFGAELDYAAQGNTRWTMPAGNYTFQLPAVNPLVTVIAMDSNMPNEPAQPLPPDPSYYTQTEEEVQTQLVWLQQTLSQPTTTPFQIVIAHHPLFSNGIHGDNHTLINNWLPLFNQYGVDLYLAGHDHDLQHLEIAGQFPSFVCSGGGGAALDPLNISPSTRGPFGDETHGFTHLQIKPTEMIVRHLDVNNNLLHKFERNTAGQVTIL